jgi:hypothetical protein
VAKGSRKRDDSEDDNDVVAESCEGFVSFVDTDYICDMVPLRLLIIDI